MRKLFAMVATVAMVLSMFAGIAFAAGTPTSIKLDDTTVIYTGDNDDDISITGKVLDENDGILAANVGVEIVVDLPLDADVTFSTVARSGSFTLKIPGDTIPGTYEVLLTATPLVKEEVTVTYAITTDDTLGFTWGQTGDFIYEGRLAGVTDGTVSIVDADGVAVSEPVSSRGQFSFLLDREDDFATPGKLQLVWNEGAAYDAATDVLVAEGEIKAAAITIDATESVVYGLLQSMVVEIDYDEDLILEDATDVEVIVYEDLDDEIIYKNWDHSWNFAGEGDYKSTDTFTPAKADLGTYTLVVNLLVNDEVAYTAQQEFVVGKPSSVNLIGLDTEVTVEDGYEFELGTDLTMSKMDRDGAPVAADSYDIVATGAGVDFDNDDMDAADLNAKEHIKNGSTVTLEPTMGGEITLVITGYEADGDQIGSFTKTITVVGGVATINITSLEIKTAGTVTVKVVNEKGQAVNNAKILFDGTGGNDYTINPNRTANIVDGTYTWDIKTTTTQTQSPDTFDVSVIGVDSNGDDTVIAKTEDFAVVGKDVYDVTMTLGKDVLAGIKTNTTLTVKEGNAFVFPHDSVTVKTAKKAAVPVTLGDKVDTNSDGIKDSYKIEIPALTTAGTYTMTVKNDATGTKIGTLEFEVVKPVLSVNVDKVTNDVNSKFTFSVVDPRDNSILDWDVELNAEYATIFTVTEFEDKLLEYEVGVDDGEAIVDVPAYEEAHEMVVLVNISDAQAKAAEDDDNTVPNLFFTTNGVTLDKVMEIHDAVLSANPAAVLAGTPTDVTLTLVDANGTAMAEYDVYRAGTKVGETDENGQLLYQVSQIGTDPIEFKAHLDYVDEGADAGDDDDDVISTASVKVTPGFDTAAPVVTAPETTTTGTAMITVTDNVAVTTLVINGSPVTIYIPQKEITHVVNLNLGVNTFNVQAYDGKNIVNKTVTITYTPAANNSTVLQGGAVERKGDYVFVQIRQFEDLGATLTWNATAKTATFVAGGKTVEVTVGSTTAKVNGAAATMPAAPILVNGRVMVPTRFIAEALGWKVDWAAGDVVTITLP